MFQMEDLLKLARQEVLPEIEENVKNLLPTKSESRQEGDLIISNKTTQSDIILKLNSDIDEAVKKILSPVFVEGSPEEQNYLTNAQGDLVMKLKSEKAPQPEIVEVVKMMCTPIGTSNSNSQV